MVLVGVEKDENEPHFRKWFVTEDAGEGEASAKDNDEGNAGEGGTPEKQERRVTSLGTYTCLTPPVAAAP